VTDRVRVRVPGSSANLGPGFDVLAAALELHLELEVERTGAFALETDLPVARDRRNLAVRAFARLADPGAFAFRVRSDIPLSGGLGSSAAASVAGLLAAAALEPEAAVAAAGAGGPAARAAHDVPALAPLDVLGLAAELEGHPDNAAAAVLGGFVACAPGGAPVRIDPPPGLEAVLVVPDRPVRTREARAALPARVPLAEAVFNVGAAARLVVGLERGDLDLLAGGLDDRLHQPHRARLYPRSSTLVTYAREAYGALGATISGAGPTVLVWARAADAGRVEAALREDAEGWARVVRAGFAAAGAVVARG
jgi:homoserine kinase